MEQPPGADAADGDEAPDPTVADAAPAAAMDDTNLRAEASQRLFQQRMEAQRAAVGDADDVCTAFMDNLFEDIFMEMRETQLNARAFAVAAQMACAQVWDGTCMAAADADLTLDANANGHSIKDHRSNSSGQRQQILKPSYSDDVESSPGTTSPKRRPRRNEHSSGAAASADALAVSLSRLLVFLERERECVDRHLMAFDGSTFNSTADKHAVGKWSIGPDSMEEFLLYLSSTCTLSLPLSAIRFVLSANAVIPTDRKPSIRASSLFDVEGIVALVQKAIALAVQQLADAIAAATSSRNRNEQSAQGGSCFFPTEVPTQLPAADPSEADEDDTVLSCYKDESDPQPSPIDRNAPGTITKKNAVVITMTARNLARKVVSAMKPAPNQNSRWVRLRSKILLESPMESASAREGPVESTPPKPNAGSNSVSPKKKATAANAKTSELIIQPDAAALSNIFSLGTPRQLSAAELARRNDILSTLERDEEKRVRRMATASFVALTLPSDSPDNGSFQKYVSSISSVTISEGALVPAGSAFVAPASTEPNSVGQKPKRPEQQNKRGAGRDPVASIGVRSKFELEHDPPHYTISDGNIHSRSDQNGMDFAMCSPIKRSKVQRSMAQVGSKPEPPPGPISSGKLDKDYQPRPIETDSDSHLPRLETSRLATGVRAVVHGVEKHGPKRHPSRNARRQLHNYCVRSSWRPHSSS